MKNISFFNTYNNKKYLRGNIRILSDLLFCSIFCWISVISKGDASFGSILGGIMGPFFWFFFWSWNSSHVQERFARWIIHVLCGCLFILPLLLIGLIAYNPIGIFSSYFGWFMIAICFGGFSLVIRKYRRIMWPKNCLIKDTK